MRNISKAVDGNDIVALVGLIMLGSGLYQISPALALVVVGGLLLAIGVVGTLRRGKP